MAGYELTFILPPEADEAAVEGECSAIAQRIEALGGKVLGREVWGRRRTGYKVGGEREGLYVFMRLECPGAQAAELVHSLRIREKVRRHLLVRAGSQGPAPAEEPVPAESA